MISTVMSKMIFYFKNDVKRINHALKVHGFASTIAGLENLAVTERTIVELAAILHDIGIKVAEQKHNSTAGNYQELEGPPIARAILAECGLTENIIERVCFLIGNHHSYAKVDGPDFQVLIEADFIVNIFEDAMQPNAIEAIKNKYFKTKAGKELLVSIYPS